MNTEIKRQWLEMKARLEAEGAAQEELAAASGASQATVSRVLQRCPSRSGRAFRKLCIYAQEKSQPKAMQRTDYVCNQDLSTAIHEVWNGTPEHARALAAMIRAAGVAARISKN